MVGKKIYLLPGLFVLLLGACTNVEKKANDPGVENAALPVDTLAYLARGGEITGAVFKSMSGKLKSAMEASGVSGAVEYCNLAASPLVDSLATAYQVTIRRTSHRLRNPANAPSAMEQSIIDQYLQLGPQQLPAPQIEVESDKVHYYAPIFLMDNCLKCHGDVTRDIATTDYEVIKRLYPDDLATGFKSGELRGIWSLTFASR